VVNQSSERCDGDDLGTCPDGIPPGLVTIGCEAPGDADQCDCCSRDLCVISAGGVTNCCDRAVCQDTTGAGQVRSGACIPPSCMTDADCNGYRCVGGACCGNAGALCGVAGCCPDSGTTCTFSEAVFQNLCCNPAGVACTDYRQCCSLSCTSGTCD